MYPTRHAPTTHADAPVTAPTMTVRVPDWDANWGRAASASHPLVRTLTISARCPICGGERGAPSPKPSTCDGENYTVDVWTNPCGHIDMYEAVLVEAGVTQPPRLP